MKHLLKLLQKRNFVCSYFECEIQSNNLLFVALPANKTNQLSSGQLCFSLQQTAKPTDQKRASTSYRNKTTKRKNENKVLFGISKKLFKNVLVHYIFTKPTQNCKQYKVLPSTYYNCRCPFLLLFLLALIPCSFMSRFLRPNQFLYVLSKCIGFRLCCFWWRS